MYRTLFIGHFFLNLRKRVTTIVAVLHCYISIIILKLITLIDELFLLLFTVSPGRIKAIAQSCAEHKSASLQIASNVSWTSLGPLLKCTFCYFSQSNALVKSQLLTLIRIELLNINFNVGFNSC